MNLNNINICMANRTTQATNYHNLKNNDKDTVQQKNKDTYIHEKEGSLSATKTNADLTKAEIYDLAKRYDVNNMSYEQRVNLVNELERKGILDKKEAFIIKTGASPVPDEVANGGVGEPFLLPDEDDPYSLGNLPVTNCIGNCNIMTKYLKNMQRMSSSPDMQGRYQSYILQ